MPATRFDHDIRPAALQQHSVVDLLEKPLQLILADHQRIRALCTALIEVGEGDRPNLTDIHDIIEFLANDFLLHITDENEDLFPRLIRRARPHDKVTAVIEKLCREHEADRADLDGIADTLTMLGDLLPDEEPENEALKKLEHFAESKLHHLMTENAIVIPLAQARLTEADYNSMSKRMAARRGLEK